MGGHAGAANMRPGAEDAREILHHHYQTTCWRRGQSQHWSASWGMPWGVVSTPWDASHSSATGIDEGHLWERESPVGVREDTDLTVARPALEHWSSGGVSGDTHGTGRWNQTGVVPSAASSAQPVDRLKCARKWVTVAHCDKSDNTQTCSIVSRFYERFVSPCAGPKDERASRILPGEYNLDGSCIGDVRRSVGPGAWLHQNPGGDARLQLSSQISFLSTQFWNGSHRRELHAPQSGTYSHWKGEGQHQGEQPSGRRQTRQQHGSLSLTLTTPLHRRTVSPYCKTGTAPS